MLWVAIEILDARNRTVVLSNLVNVMRVSLKLWVALSMFKCVNTSANHILLHYTCAVLAYFWEETA